MADTDYGISREQFFQEYGDALVHGYAAVFAGAGLSRGAGFTDWKGLLRGFAAELGLDLEIESDYVAVAQYHINAAEQNRNRLHQKIVDEFSGPVDISPTHQALVALPIRTYWTSNYDDLIENALKGAGKHVDVKKSAPNLSLTSKGANAIVFKLHGDLGDAGTLIITRDDYDNYERRFPGFRDQLRADLTSKTFLFIGFSFADPHLDFILAQLKRERGSNMRQHFAIMRRESHDGRTHKQFKYAANRQRLRIRDLRRYGVNTILIEDYGEIYDLLRLLRLRYLRRQVFISGAAVDFSPRGEDWIERLSFDLGKALMQHDFNLVSGLGVGLGRSVISGALEELYGHADPRIDQRLLLWPFPAEQHKSSYRKHRQLMLAMAGFAVFISGNRLGENGTVVDSPGVFEEFDLARATSIYPLPVGSTGWAAAELWKKVNDEFTMIFPHGTPKRPFNMLNKANTTVEQIIDALLTLMRHLQPT